MPKYLDLENWSRRELFEFFIDYSNPYFNVCAKVEVTKLVTLVRARPDVKFSSAIHYFALRVANEIEPFRYRLENRKVVVYEVVHGGTTVLKPNETFAYAYFDYQPDFEKFTATMSKAVDEIRNDIGP
jgi:chloramphenicol O-acetyltransferase type A